MHGNCSLSLRHAKSPGMVIDPLAELTARSSIPLADLTVPAPTSG